ncbi:neurotrypsin-like isoform X2 [Argopecten irradians]|uniref:neurotrypsin-like isoform X2 n=1 Tax=Argopecten irradians TaxID=31199 RepID=UPI00372140E9
MMASYIPRVFVLLIYWHHSTASTTTEPSFAIRLENGLYNHSGRVGVYHDGQWGGVCDVGWSYNEANVVCRMLEYSNGTLISRYTTESAWYKWFSNDTDPNIIWMYNVQCDGTESSLEDCPFAGWGVGQDCDNQYMGPAYVFCYNEDDSPMAVRLVNGRDDGYGHIEVHYSSIWGGLAYGCCDDNEAKVVCRMLGYGHDIRHGATLMPFNTIPVWGYRRCAGNESSLEDCPIDQTNYGSVHMGIATVLCYNDSQADNNNESVYLVDAENGTSGAVDVVYGGQRTTVCSGNWGDTEADIVCRMLGFRDGTAIYFQKHAWESKADLILKINVNCSGSETSIYECSFSRASYYCLGPYQIARGGVSCTEPTGNFKFNIERF